MTFEYKANKEERRKEETKTEEKSLENGLLSRLEVLGLCKAEEKEKLDNARSCSQVGLCQHCHDVWHKRFDDDGVNVFRRNGKSLWWSSAKD